MGDDDDDDDDDDDNDDDELVPSAATTTVNTLNCVSRKVKNVGKVGLWGKVTQNNKKEGTRNNEQLDNTLTTFPRLHILEGERTSPTNENIFYFP